MTIPKKFVGMLWRNKMFPQMLSECLLLCLSLHACVISLRIIFTGNWKPFWRVRVLIRAFSTPITPGFKPFQIQRIFIFQNKPKTGLWRMLNLQVIICLGYRSQTDIGILQWSVKKKTSSAQHSFNCRWGLHGNDFTSPPHPHHHLDPNSTPDLMG